MLEVHWGVEPKQAYPVNIQMDAYDRSGLLRDVSSVLDKVGLNVLAIRTKSAQGHVGVSVRMKITIELSTIEQLSRVMARLREIPNMIHVQRLDES